MDLRLRLPYAFKRGDAEPTLGPQDQALHDLLHGKYYALTKNGRHYSMATTPLGKAIVIYTATALADALAIWNPPGSGVNVIPTLYSTHRASGTAAFAAIGTMVRTEGVPAAIATGAEITAFAETTPRNQLVGVGKGQASRVLSSTTGTVTISAGVAGEWERTVGNMNLEADTGTAHITILTTHDFEGTLVLGPGSLFWPAATKASVAVFASSIMWAEEDV